MLELSPGFGGSWGLGGVIVKVFVSSTSRDLTDFRAAAIRSLRRLGHEVVAMEEFTAATSFPLNRVLKLVREADAYILIVAWRYGFTPDCSNVSDLPAAGEDSLPEVHYGMGVPGREREPGPTHFAVHPVRNGSLATAEHRRLQPAVT